MHVSWSLARAVFCVKEIQHGTMATARSLRSLSCSLNTSTLCTYSAVVCTCLCYNHDTYSVFVYMSHSGGVTQGRPSAILAGDHSLPGPMVNCVLIDAALCVKCFASSAYC